MPAAKKGKKAQRSRPSTGATKKDRTDRWTARPEVTRPQQAPGAVQWAIRYAGPAASGLTARSERHAAVLCRCPALGTIDSDGAEDSETEAPDRTKEMLAMVHSASGAPYTAPDAGGTMPTHAAARASAFERMTREVLKWQWCATLAGKRVDSVGVPHEHEEIDEEQREVLNDWHLMRRVEAMRPIAADPLAKATRTLLAKATVDEDGKESAGRAIKSTGDGSYMEVWVREPCDMGENVPIIQWADCAILGQFGPEPFYLVGSGSVTALQTHDFSDRRTECLTVDVSDIMTPFIAIAAAHAVFGRAKE